MHINSAQHDNFHLISVKQLSIANCKLTSSAIESIDTFQRQNYLVNIYLLKVANRDTRKRCETYSKLTIKTPERYQWCRSIFTVSGDTHMTSTLRRRMGVRQEWDAIGCRGGGGYQVFRTFNLYLFLLKKSGVVHHAKPNVNILLTRNLTFDSDFRQWDHPLMMPLHFLWAKSNKRTRGQFECDLTWFCFCFDFVRSHVRCDCCSIVCLRFQVVQIKQVDCKMRTKNVNNYK